MSTARVTAVGPVEVAAGANASGVLWTPAFKLRRMDGTSASAGAGDQACQAEGFSLCTEPQWSRACGAEPKLGDAAGWALSADAAVVVTRGGGGSCDARGLAAGVSSAATLCCSRAIAVQSSNKNAGFLNTTTTKLAAWEAALNSRSADAVAALVDDNYAYNGRRLGRQKYAELAAGFFRSNPAYRAYFVSCNLSIQQVEDTWTAECKTVMNLQSTTTPLTQRLVWGGVSGKIESMAEVEVNGKPTGARDLPAKASPSGTGGDRDQQCRQSCPGDPVELTHCYCVCTGGCSE